MLRTANKAFSFTQVNARLAGSPRFGRQLGALLLAAALALFAPAGTVKAADTPEQTVQDVNEALLFAMRNAADLGFEGRHAYLAPLLKQSFDLSAMAQIAVGRHWRSFSDAEKQALIERFTELSISTFASRFDGFSGERWRVVGTKEAPRGGMIVENRLITGDGETIPIDYLVHQTDGGWKILDVYLDGSISELALRRSEFTSVLKSDGVDGLLQQIAQQVDKLGTAKTLSTN